MRKFLYTTLFLLLSLPSSAQLRVTEHLLINNGLSNNYITDLIQAADDTLLSDDRRPIVLVVEDNTEIRRYIASSLADDYQVIKAEFGMTPTEYLKNV